MVDILIVEDDARIRDALCEGFSVSGYRVTSVASAREAREALTTEVFQLVILEIKLPDGNGYEIAKGLRQNSDVPIVFLTTKDSESERILGFEVGADDYVIKPFSMKELLLRVQAILRRFEAPENTGAGNLQPGERRPVGGASSSDEVFELDGHELRINRAAHRLTLDGKSIEPTKSEWRIITAFANRPGEVISRSWILSECLGRPYDGSERTVDTHVANVRALLSEVDWIETVRGYGYRFVGNPRTR